MVTYAEETQMPEVHFLPWAGIDRQIAIGPVTITPWTTLRTSLPPKPVKFLDNYFSRYRTNDNKPVDDISVASITPNALDDITNDQRTTIRQAVDALTFASTIPNLRTTIISGNHFGIPNSERFQLITQLLGDYKNFIAVRAGGVLHGWGVNQIHFCQPWEVGTNSYTTDDELLGALGMLLGGKHKRLGQRMFRTLEWFRLSHTAGSETSDLSRLVMKATGFEVLLEPTDPFSKKGPMRERLHTLTDSKKLKERAVRIGKDKKSGKVKFMTVNAVAAWFHGFYDLRNSIVHGDQIAHERFIYHAGTRNLPQLAIADLVLWEAISWELFAKKLIGGKSRKFANWLSKRAEKTKADEPFMRHVFAGNHRIDDYHGALRWNRKK